MLSLETFCKMQNMQFIFLINVFFLLLIHFLILEQKFIFLECETKISINLKYYMAQMIKNLPAMQESWVQPLDWDDSVKKGVANQSNILAWKIPGKRSLAIISPWSPGSPSVPQSTGLQRVTYSETINTFIFSLSWPI